MAAPWVPGRGGDELGWPLQPCNLQCPVLWWRGIGAVWGHWPLLGEGLRAGAASQQSCSPQANSNVSLLAIPFPSHLLPVVVVAVCKITSPETKQNWKASDKFGSVKNKGKTAFFKVIATWLRAASFPSSPAANSPAAGHTARLATSLVACPSRAAFDFFGAQSPSSPQSLPCWSWSLTLPKLYFSHSSLGTCCHWQLMMKKPFPLVL